MQRQVRGASGIKTSLSDPESVNINKNNDWHIVAYISMTADSYKHTAHKHARFMARPTLTTTCYNYIRNGDHINIINTT